MAFSKVLLSHRPTVDRIGAFDIVQKALGLELEIEFVNQTISLSDADVRTLINDGVIPIGVGKGRTYRERNIDGKKFGSETALALYNLRAVGHLPSADQALDDFAAMMSGNNDDGYLIRQPYSVNQILRDAYRLGHDPEEVEYTFSDQEIVRRGSHVVRTYLDAREKGGFDLAAREQIKRIFAIELLPEWARSHNGPMTVLRYMRDMCLLGVAEDEMRERALWLIRINDRAAQKEQQAEARVAAGDFETFEIFVADNTSIWNGRGTWVDSDDLYLLKALAGRRQLVTMRSRAGNVIIMSKAFSLAKVGAALQTQEPERWHVEHGKRNIVANGTESVMMPATGLSRRALEYTISAHAIRKQQ